MIGLIFRKHAKINKHLTPNAKIVNFERYCLAQVAVPELQSYLAYSRRCDTNSSENPEVKGECYCGYINFVESKYAAI